VTAQGWNAPDLRKRNRAGILRLVHRQGDIARNELALALGLTKAAVTILVNELIDDGLIVEAGEQAGAKRAGRRKIALRIRPEAGRILGVGIDAERVQVLLADLSGAVLGVRDLPPPGALPGAAYIGGPPPGALPGAAPLRDSGGGAAALPGGDGEAGPRADRIMGARIAVAVCAAAADLAGGNDLSALGIVGAGLGVTGRVDEERGVSLREPRLWAAPVALREPLEAALKLCVSVDNNVRSLALAELLLTDARAEAPAGLLFVKYGPGVGASWTMGGTPWPGAHHRSGELGHTVVASEGPTCPYCGRVGCLESLVSAHALEQALTQSGAYSGSGGYAPSAGRPASPSGSRTDELCELLRRSDPAAYERLASRFALALGNAIELCDPTAVVLYGTPFRQGPLFDEIARRVEANERPCDIRRSAMDPALPALGGAALALERFFADGGAACSARI
jgi:predicted NBD/HSP70 family sugar kinase